MPAVDPSCSEVAEPEDSDHCDLIDVAPQFDSDTEEGCVDAFDDAMGLEAPRWDEDNAKPKPVYTWVHPDPECCVCLSFHVDNRILSVAQRDAYPVRRQKESEFSY
ncbi:hypothetical protein B0T21DRAFT_362457 [Apiosordaria backusii]|uniref:Uncharacterized protein n=1 Tax=Apiosordaria backusii TaxID=314023 RepID=A0AA40EGP3_9PEZI|nr:hypothetical protein B0T21DRAFT_362457 [Apiosordaria backusii]